MMPNNSLHFPLQGFMKVSAIRSVSTFVFAAMLVSFIGVSPAFAGFSISVVPVSPKIAIPAVGKPRLVLSKGMSLKAVVSTFAGQYGWSVAWTAGDVYVDEAQSFSGLDHEQVLAAVLRRYKLTADRYPTDKGYMIYGTPDGEINKGAK